MFYFFILILFALGNDSGAQTSAGAAQLASGLLANPADLAPSVPSPCHQVYAVAASCPPGIRAGLDSMYARGTVGFFIDPLNQQDDGISSPRNTCHKYHRQLKQASVADLAASFRALDYPIPMPDLAQFAQSCFDMIDNGPNTNRDGNLPKAYLLAEFNNKYLRLEQTLDQLLQGQYQTQQMLGKPFRLDCQQFVSKKLQEKCLHFRQCQTTSEKDPGYPLAMEGQLSNLARDLNEIAALSRGPDRKSLKDIRTRAEELIAQNRSLNGRSMKELLNQAVLGVKFKFDPEQRLIDKRIENALTADLRRDLERMSEDTTHMQQAQRCLTSAGDIECPDLEKTYAKTLRAPPVANRYQTQAKLASQAMDLHECVNNISEARNEADAIINQALVGAALSFTPMATASLLKNLSTVASLASKASLAQKAVVAGTNLAWVAHEATKVSEVCAGQLSYFQELQKEQERSCQDYSTIAMLESNLQACHQQMLISAAAIAAPLVAQGLLKNAGEFLNARFGESPIIKMLNQEIHLRHQGRTKGPQTGRAAGEAEERVVTGEFIPHPKAAPAKPSSAGTQREGQIIEGQKVEADQYLPKPKHQDLATTSASGKSRESITREVEQVPTSSTSTTPAQQLLLPPPSRPPSTALATTTTQKPAPGTSLEPYINHGELNPPGQALSTGGNRLTYQPPLQGERPPAIVAGQTTSASSRASSGGPLAPAPKPPGTLQPSSAGTNQAHPGGGPLATTNGRTLALQQSKAPIPPKAGILGSTSPQTPVLGASPLALKVGSPTTTATTEAPQANPSGQDDGKDDGKKDEATKEEKEKEKGDLTISLTSGQIENTNLSEITLTASLGGPLAKIEGADKGQYNWQCDNPTLHRCHPEANTHQITVVRDSTNSYSITVQYTVTVNGKEYRPQSSITIAPIAPTNNPTTPSTPNNPTPPDSSAPATNNPNSPQALTIAIRSNDLDKLSLQEITLTTLLDGNLKGATGIDKGQYKWDCGGAPCPVPNNESQIKVKRDPAKDYEVKVTYTVTIEGKTYNPEAKVTIKAYQAPVDQKLTIGVSLEVDEEDTTDKVAAFNIEVEPPSEQPLPPGKITLTCHYVNHEDDKKDKDEADEEESQGAEVDNCADSISGKQDSESKNLVAKIEMERRTKDYTITATYTLDDQSEAQKSKYDIDSASEVVEKLGKARTKKDAPPPLPDFGGRSGKPLAPPIPIILDDAGTYMTSPFSM